jgi:hypothetical protein
MFTSKSFHLTVFFFKLEQAALALIDQNWQQPKCLSQGEWINCGLPHNGTILSYKKKQHG